LAEAYALPVVVRHQNGAVFSHSKTNEMWTLLLEKAYAKLHGGYQQIETGYGIRYWGGPYDLVWYTKEVGS
jgi:hypothetical protein